MQMGNSGNLENVKELLDKGVDVAAYKALA